MYWIIEIFLVLLRATLLLIFLAMWFVAHVVAK
jgi:hypothetical protein